MSDFDKEAEREKLREKYERDKQKREATEQMSELLLKGATMTNSHCGTCGDPIFRYEGQEFCPTCEEVVAEADDAAESPDDTAGEAGDGPARGTADADDEGTGQQTGDVERSQAPTENGRADTPPATDADTPGTDRQPDTGSRPETAPSGTAAPAEQTTEPGTQQDASAPEPTVPGSSNAEPSSPAPATTSASGATETGSPGTDPGGSLATARASLTRTVTRLAQQAEAAEDLERARAYLVATEEAADALDAVKQADR